MAQCQTLPLSTLFSTVTSTETSTEITTSFTVTSVDPITSTSTTTLCATEVPVGSTCETTSTTSEIVVTTPGFDWTSTIISTITHFSTSTSLLPTSTVFTTTCSETSPPNPPPTSDPPPNNDPPTPTPPTTTPTTLTTTTPPPTASGSDSLTQSTTSSTGSPRLNDDGTVAGGGSGGAGKTAGIVLGSVLGAALLGTLLFWFWRRRMSHWDDIFEDSDDEGTGGRAGRGWKAVGGAPMVMLRHRRTRRSKARVDLDPTPGPYEYGLVGSSGMMSTPTAAVGLLGAAAEAGIHTRNTSSASAPDTPTSLGPVVRPASAMALGHARTPSSPDGSFSLPPTTQAPLIDYSTPSHGTTTQFQRHPMSATGHPLPDSRSGSPVSMDFGAIGATLPRSMSTRTAATTATGASMSPSVFSPAEQDFGRIGIRPMSTSTVSTVATSRTERPGRHDRIPSFGTQTLAALDHVVAGQVAGQQSPQPTSPRTLKSSDAQLPSPTQAGTSSPPVIVHRDAGPAPPDYLR